MAVEIDQVEQVVPGLKVGHWTDREAGTGCTVVIFPEGTVASGEVRGGAPATREFALLDPTKTVANVDAVILSGGSAFGLAAADGVMAELENLGRGVPTAFGAVPIVVGMSLFDLAVGSSTARPGPEQGRIAARKAMATDGSTIPVGAIGAATGATVDKWSGHPKPSGLGVGTRTVSVDGGSLAVTAVIAVNAFGAVDDGSGTEDPGPPAPPRLVVEEESGAAPDEGIRTNTTIGVVVTNARLDKVECRLLAEGAHNGFARSLMPAHTRFDGDAIVAAATGEIEADVSYVRALVQAAVVDAVRSTRRLN